MPPLPARDERDGDELPRLVLSMRTKVSIVGLCFVLGMSFFVYTNVPYAVEALSSNNGTSETEQEYVTLFRDNFDSPNPHWKIFQGTGLSTCTYRDGYLFLNLTENQAITQVGIHDLSPGKLFPDPWLYANLEIRLRFIDEGIPETGTGAASKHWGFRESQGFEQGANALQFSTWDNVSEDIFVGFWAQVQSSINGGKIHNEKIDTDEIGLGEWHTYRYLWQPDNGTLVIDNVTVATTDIVPNTTLGINLLSHGIRRTGSDWDSVPYGYHMFPAALNTSMQVDYVHVYVTREYFDELDAEISDFLNAAQQIIQELTNNGENTTHLNRYFNEARNLWREGYFLFMPARHLLVPFMEVLYKHDQIMADFIEAESIIDTLREQGDTRNANIQNSNLEKARVFWEECNYKNTNEYLQKIRASVPEAGILTAFGLVTPLFILKRHRVRS